MGKETPINGIWDLNTAYPLTTDSRREGDDHLRLIKDAIKKTFPSVVDVVNCTEDELNILDGVSISTTELNFLDDATANIQEQIDSPLIMRADKNNSINGYLNIQDNILLINSDNSTAGQAFIYLRNSAGTNKFTAYLYPTNSSTRSDAFALLNNTGNSKFIIRQNAATLELTSANATFNGIPLATSTNISDLITLIGFCTKDASFVETTNFTINGTSTTSWNTGFGTDSFQWGFSGINSTSHIACGYSNNGKYLYAGNPGATPAFAAPFSAATGHVALKNITSASNTTVNLWARKNDTK